MDINWDVTVRFNPNSLDPSTHGIPIPTYGNYGGPNYTAGVVGGTTPEIPNPAPVNDLDFLFWEHDLVYQHFKDGTATPTDIAQADVQLVESLNLLTQTEPELFNDPENLLYEGLAALTIGAKILTTPAELAYLVSHPADQFLVAQALGAAVTNFETGLAETPASEVRSLHGAFQVFEAHFGDLLLVG
jgi:hypothetical protein